MKITRLAVLFLSLILLGGSCKKGEDTVAPGNCSNVEKLAEAYTNSLKAYLNSQTKANCEAFKKAGNDYITAASSCSGVAQAAISDARASIRDIVCN